MATKRPISPNIRGLTEEEMGRSNQAFGKLCDLVPRKLAEKLMREELEKIDKEIQKEREEHPGDGLMLAKMIIDGPLEDSYRKKNKIIKFLLKSFWRFYLYFIVLINRFRKIKYSEEELKQKTENLVGTVAKDWVCTLWSAIDRKELNQVILLDELLLPNKSFAETFKEDMCYFDEINSWLKLAVSNTIRLLPEDKAVELNKAFIANSKKEIDEYKKNGKDFLVMVGVDYTGIIDKDDQGYFLKIIKIQ